MNMYTQNDNVILELVSLTLNVLEYLNLNTLRILRLTSPLSQESQSPSVTFISVVEGGAGGSLQVPLPTWQDPIHRLLR